MSGMRWRGSQSFSQLTDIEQEVRQQLAALRGVDDFGMELNAVNGALGIFDSGDGTGGGASEDGEARGSLFHGVAVAHPDLLLIEPVGEERTCGREVQAGEAVFAFLARLDSAAE